MQAILLSWLQPVVGNPSRPSLWCNCHNTPFQVLTGFLFRRARGAMPGLIAPAVVSTAASAAPAAQATRPSSKCNTRTLHLVFVSVVSRPRAIGSMVRHTRARVGLVGSDQQHTTTNRGFFYEFNLFEWDLYWYGAASSQAQQVGKTV